LLKQRADAVSIESVASRSFHLRACKLLLKEGYDRTVEIAMEGRAVEALRILADQGKQPSWTWRHE